MNKIFFFIFFAPLVSSEDFKYLVEVENGLQRFCNAINYVTYYLEDFNDRHLGDTEWGRMLGYEDVKPVIRNSDSGRAMKKMSMAMMPLLFHVGATSTWMILTSIMAVKGVVIGLILLVFKIAVSSAKVASFFTLLKSKHDAHHEYSWTPHPHGHYGTDRSLNEIPHHAEWNSYTPEWSQSEPHKVSDYKTVPTFKENHIGIPYADIEYEGPKISSKDR